MYAEGAYCLHSPTSGYPWLQCGQGYSFTYLTYISLHVPLSPTGRSLWDIGSWREPRTYTRPPYPTCGANTHTCAPWPTCAAPPHICLHRLRAWRVGLLTTSAYSPMLFLTVNKLTGSETRTTESLAYRTSCVLRGTR